MCPQYGKFIAEIQRIRETTEEVSKETADAIFKRTSYEISTGKSRGIFEEIHKKILKFRKRRYSLEKYEMNILKNLCKSKQNNVWLENGSLDPEYSFTVAFGQGSDMFV